MPTCICVSSGKGPMIGAFRAAAGSFRSNALNRLEVRVGVAEVVELGPPQPTSRTRRTNDPNALAQALLRGVRDNLRVRDITKTSKRNASTDPGYDSFPH